MIAPPAFFQSVLIDQVSRCTPGSRRTADQEKDQVLPLSQVCTLHLVPCPVLSKEKNTKLIRNPEPRIRCCPPAVHLVPCQIERLHLIRSTPRLRCTPWPVSGCQKKADRVLPRNHVQTLNKTLQKNKWPQSWLREITAADQRQVFYCKTFHKIALHSLFIFFFTWGGGGGGS